MLEDDGDRMRQTVIVLFCIPLQSFSESGGKGGEVQGVMDLISCACFLTLDGCLSWMEGRLGLLILLAVLTAFCSPPWFCLKTEWMMKRRTSTIKALVIDALTGGYGLSVGEK